MNNLHVTDYGTLKSDALDFEEITIKDFVKQIEEYFLEKIKADDFKFDFDKTEDECIFGIGYDKKYKIRLNSEDLKNVKIMSYYNELINKLSKCNSFNNKKTIFNFLSFVVRLLW